MKIKKLFLVMILLSSGFFAVASASDKKKIAYSLEDFQKLDTTQWIVQSIFPKKDADDTLNQEKAEIFFPNQPKHFELGGQQEGFSAKDDEGMKFTVVTLEAHYYDLTEEIDSFVKTMEYSSHWKKFHVIYPQNEQDNSGHLFLVSNDGHFERMKIVKRLNYVYFLSANVIDKNYLDIDKALPGTAAYKKIIKDTAKATAFFDSFHQTSGSGL